MGLKYSQPRKFLDFPLGVSPCCLSVRAQGLRGFAATSANSIYIAALRPRDSQDIEQSA